MRIFPAQESANVFVGWVTSDFHTFSTKFMLEQVRKVTVTLGDDRGKVSDRYVQVCILKVLSLKLINFGLYQLINEIF